MFAHLPQPLQQWLHRHRRTLLKTASYYCVHIAVAVGVAYAVTGNIWIAMTLSLLEPTVQMLFFFVHEKLWEPKKQERFALEQQAFKA